MPEEKKDQEQGHVNQIALDTIQSITARLTVAQDAIKIKDGQIADFAEKLKQANDVIEGFERAPLILDITNRSSIPIEELSKKTTAELKNMLDTLNTAKAPTANSVRFQVNADAQSKTADSPLLNLFGKKLGEK